MNGKDLFELFLKNASVVFGGNVRTLLLESEQERI